MRIHSNKQRNWIKGGDITFASNKGDKDDASERINAIINGERIKGQSAIHIKVDELNMKYLYGQGVMIGFLVSSNADRSIINC